MGMPAGRAACLGGGGDGGGGGGGEGGLQPPGQVITHQAMAFLPGAMLAVETTKQPRSAYSLDPGAT
jgi:hypothetical protein